MIPILWMRKQMFREVTQIIQGHKTHVVEALNLAYPPCYTIYSYWGTCFLSAGLLTYL